MLLQRISGTVCGAAVTAAAVYFCVELKVFRVHSLVVLSCGLYTVIFAGLQGCVTQSGSLTGQWTSHAITPQSLMPCCSWYLTAA